jgi:arginase
VTGTAPTGSPRVTLLGVPYDESSSFLRGAAAGPAAIRQALQSPSSNFFSERGVDIAESGLLSDGGDVATTARSSVGAAIQWAVSEILATGSRPLVLGGDHSILPHILRAVHAVRGPISVVQVDAHPDLYPEFEGQRDSHACGSARALEEGSVAQFIQVGIRTMSTPQQEAATQYGVEVIGMRAWEHGARPRPRYPVYLSIDLDGLDPSYAPGVSHPEPGGLSTREVVAMIHALGQPIVGADIVELNPVRDVMDLTARVGAKLLKELVAAMTAAPASVASNSAR